jgi:hypothetical protein
MEIQLIQAKMAIAERIDQYALLFDKRNFTEKLPDLFVDDASVNLPPGDEDHDGIVGLDAYHERTMVPFGPTHHVFANYLIDVQGNTAAFRANTLVTHVIPESGQEGASHLFIAGGVLTGTAMRTGNIWKFSQIKLDPVWRQGEF